MWLFRQLRFGRACSGHTLNATVRACEDGARFTSKRQLMRCIPRRPVASFDEGHGGSTKPIGCQVHQPNTQKSISTR